ncbi:MAG: oligosaccharide flippase family protein, partial [Caldilineaceae bacterium]|nr:oligosaccharide flippase family protein [Caldilineaceae bacterium]
MSLPAERTSSSSSESTASGSTVRTDRRVLLNTSALAASSLWRIGLSFVLQIFIANRLGAVGLGQYTTALAYLNVCQVLGELGLPQLLVRDLARHPGHRRHYFATALLLQIGASFVVWGALSALVWFLPLQADTRLALIVITASLPMYAVSSVCAMIFQAGERMEVVMSVEMAVNTLIVGISLWILWRGGGVVQLAAVLIASQTASMALYLWILRRSALLVDGVATTVAPSMWSTMRTMLGQARPFYGLALANVLLHRLDVLLLSALAGEAITGIYSAAYLVVRILMILSQTFWQALYPTLSRLHHQAVAQYRQLTNLAVRYGLMVLLPVAALGSGAVTLLLTMVIAALLSRTLKRWVEWLLTRLPLSAQTLPIWQKLAVAFHAYRTQPAALVWTAISSALIVLLTSVNIWLIARALQPNAISMIEVLAINPIIVFALIVVPLAPGGLGIRQASFASLFLLIG